MFLQFTQWKSVFSHSRLEWSSRHLAHLGREKQIFDVWPKRWHLKHLVGIYIAIWFTGFHLLWNFYSLLKQCSIISVSPVILIIGRDFLFLKKRLVFRSEVLYLAFSWSHRSLWLRFGSTCLTTRDFLLWKLGLWLLSLVSVPKAPVGQKLSNVFSDSLSFTCIEIPPLTSW